MDEILKALASLLPNLSKKQYAQIVKMLGIEDAVLITSVDDVKEDETMKSVTVAEIAKQLQGIGYTVNLPGMSAEATRKSVSPPYEPDPIVEGEQPEDDDAKKSRKALDFASVMRFGDHPEMKSLLDDVLEGDYRQIVHEQNIAFTKFLRGGVDVLDSKQRQLARRQIFPLKSIYDAIVNDGLDVRTIKATQVEAQGELGGIAVPPNRQSEIDTRLPGLTAVRGGGANVVTLVNSNAVEIPQWRGNSNRWIGLIRGEWGNETADPSAKNFKLDMVPVMANIYTFKVPFSQSLVEDAANLVTMLMNDIAVTMAIDEDDAFMLGDGVGKPHGILPGGVNGNSLTEVNSGAAAAMTANGLKALKRGVASQYRANAVFVANSDTYSDIEALRDDSGGVGTGQYLFPDLSDTDTLLGRKIYEHGGMPDVGAGLFAMLFGWMYGYTIVERLGMTIQRFQDSATGINKVEYHVRRRLGGKIERPWMFAVQKVAA